jgi:hypothetical protein
MSEKTQTVTGGLGLNDNFFKEAEEIVKENLEKYDTISDALAATAAEVRDGELGEVDMKITAYEKKLVLAGFVMGCIRASAEAKHKLMMLKMLEDMKGMVSGGKGSRKPPRELLEMMLNDPDLPEELRDILGQITEDGDDE